MLEGFHFILVFRIGGDGVKVFVGIGGGEGNFTQLADLTKGSNLWY
jgi:hypothetical protein